MASLAIAFVMTLSSCSEDKETSEMPVFDQLTLSPTTASPGDTITATVTFKSSGKYVKGTYSYTCSPSLVAGTFACGSSESSATFKLVIPEANEEDADDRTFILTVRPTSMAAYAGDKPFLDPAPMGSLTAQFNVIK